MSETDNHSKHYKYGLVATGTLASILILTLVTGIIPTTPLAVFGSGVSDDARFGGTFTIQHYNAEGVLLSEQEHPNLVPNEGLECTADLMFGTTDCTGESAGGFTWIDIGTGTVAPANTDTGITPIASCGRVQDASVALDTATTGQRTATVSVTFADVDCEGVAIGETAIFDASTAGNMLARALVSPTITLNSGDTLTVNYSVVLNNT